MKSDEIDLKDEIKKILMEYACDMCDCECGGDRYERMIIDSESYIEEDEIDKVVKLIMNAIRK